MLRLLGRATSANVQKVLFLLEELGIDYDREDYGRQFENTGTPAYLAMNPTKKVPTLVDDDLAVWESHTILRYLTAKAGSDLYPSDPAARSHIDRWMDWTLAALNPVFLAGFRDAKKPEAERAPDAGTNLANELKILDGQLARHPWLAGDRFSLADICCGPIVRRCLAFPYPLPPLPHLQAWCDRLKQRPAFVKASAAG